MSVTIKYNGSNVATVEGGNTATLPIKDKKMKSDIVITVPEAEGEDIPDHTESDFTLQLANTASGELGVVYSSTEKVSFEAAPSGKVIDTFVDTNFLPSNIKKNIEIFGVTGIYEGEGGSGGGEQPQLNAPTITGVGFTLNIDDSANAAFSDGYNIYVNDVFVTATTQTTVDMATITDTSKTFYVKVSAYGDKFVTSNLSAEFAFLVVVGTQGLSYSLEPNGKYYICDGIGTATDTDIVVAGIIDGIPVTKIKANAFTNRSQITSVVLPDSVTLIDSEAFAGCGKMKEITFGEGLTEISSFAFDGCSSLTALVFPASMKSFGYKPFYGCNAVKTATFKGTPPSITADTFGNMSGITDIYVPWAEGVVEGAPWGATNATIHYNSEV